MSAMGWEFTILTMVSMSSGVIFIAFLLLIVLYLTTDPYPNMERSASERCFLNPKTEEMVEFPKLEDDWSLDLSVVVPAYNEESRLPVMLDDALIVLEASGWSYEVIVVDDGSADKTTAVALSYSRRLGAEKVRVMTLERNRGKGGAVRLGMMSARGKQLLFADADGATTFSEIAKVRKAMTTALARSEWQRAVVCGSRAHLEKKSIAQRSLPRTLLMYGFRAWLWGWVRPPIRDTQCGFKLFSRQAARALFGNQHVERWAFDVDLLWLAGMLKVTIDEVCVEWREIDGSKLVPVLSWAGMGIDIALIRLRYGIGVWKVDHTLGYC